MATLRHGMALTLLALAGLARAILSDPPDLAAGIHQIQILLARGRDGAVSDHAVLGMKDHVLLQWDVIGDRGRDVYDEFDVSALPDVSCEAGAHLTAVLRLDFID